MRLRHGDPPRGRDLVARARGGSRPLDADTPDDQFRIAVGTELGALPRLDRDLILDARDPDVKKAELEERTPRVNGLRALLSEMILGSARLVRDHLMQMTYIGPLRDIPTRSYRPQVTPTRRAGPTGSLPGTCSTTTAAATSWTRSTSGSPAKNG